MNCHYCKHPYNRIGDGIYECSSCRIKFFHFLNRIELLNKNTTFGAVIFLDDDQCAFYSQSAFKWDFLIKIKMPYDTFIEQITPNNIDKWAGKIKKLQVFL